MDAVIRARCPNQGPIACIRKADLVVLIASVAKEPGNQSHQGHAAYDSHNNPSDSASAQLA